MNADARKQASFTAVMAIWSKNKIPWPEWYDTTRLLDGADLGRPLIVDVGGNVGNDLMSFAAKHPEIADGSLVLQDRPEALEHAQVNVKVQVEAHDFFTPQPVKG